MATINLTVGPGEAGNEKFGELLNELRIAAGVTRASAADILGVSSEYIRLIERGKRVPAWGGMPKIFDAYGVRYTHHGVDSWAFEDVLVKFTSRIRESRRNADDPPRSRIYQTSNRSKLIGEIVEALVQADPTTLKDIHRTLTRS